MTVHIDDYIKSNDWYARYWSEVYIAYIDAGYTAREAQAIADDAEQEIRYKHIEAYTRATVSEMTNTFRNDLTRVQNAITNEIDRGLGGIEESNYALRGAVNNIGSIMYDTNNIMVDAIDSQTNIVAGSMSYLGEQISNSLSSALTQIAEIQIPMFESFQESIYELTVIQETISEQIQSTIAFQAEQLEVIYQDLGEIIMAGYDQHFLVISQQLTNMYDEMIMLQEQRTFDIQVIMDSTANYITEVISWYEDVLENVLANNGNQTELLFNEAKGDIKDAFTFNEDNYIANISRYNDIVRRINEIG